jgi:cytochrome c oxidase assembly protein subunit 11
LLLISVVAGMVGLSFASVPLYRLFCAATGFGGATQRAETAPTRIVAGLIMVRFETQVAPGLDWEFRPLKSEIAVHPGAQSQVVFRAVNHTAVPVTAQAVYNVTPTKAGIYFDKLQCFCFNSQTLAPGQSVDMGVVFFVDPDIWTDPSTSEVRSITLSYTMFQAPETESPSASATPRPRPPSVN